MRRSRTPSFLAELPCHNLVQLYFGGRGHGPIRQDFGSRGAVQVHPRSEPDRRLRGGTLIGSSFLVLTLMGLPVLAWAVLGLVMLLALTDTVLVTQGFGLAAFGSRSSAEQVAMMLAHLHHEVSVDSLVFWPERGH